MSNPFFDRPITNSPYEHPRQHWELDETGQPTGHLIDRRRRAEFITPIPKPKKRRGTQQQELALDEGKGLSTTKQAYDLTSIINEVRGHVDAWRNLPASQWQVTPETARLLQHWRHHAFGGVRPFFCQIEAVETAIWFTEVAPHLASGKRLLDNLKAVNADANPQIERLALKLATGAGKTTVMAMLIAWQTLNAVRRQGSKHFTRGFLIVTPGLTIRDRLRVLQPNDPDNYYSTRELVPHDLVEDIKKARIVITNYHAFKRRERLELSAGGRALLEGATGPELQTLETEGQMLQRVMPELMGMKHVLALNDEAHHCYRQKPPDPDEEALKGDERKEAEKNNEAARLWISGLEAVNRTLGLQRVFDLSATPFFLNGSGYREGTLFHWTMSDFSLMDAIECGIVKLPRVPVAENIPGEEMPIYRDLWKYIAKDMPKKGRGAGGDLDPLMLPTRLKTALEALYGHYQKTFALWQQRGISVPPCFIVVCQNTAISKLVYDYISGFYRKHEDDPALSQLQHGALALFDNFDLTTGNPLARPHTLLIDSEELESGEALDDKFRAMAADEIERFRRDIVERTGDARAAETITDQELLREVMNTVGKKDQLGAGIRCVVSVSMLTEGWDANNVTHILGIRAFGTQLLCEQVIGRALRRQSYELNEDNLFDAEYADIFGVPFDFTAKPVVAPPTPPRETVQVKAVRPDRDHLEIRFPRVEGYRVELPTERLTATFNADSVLELTPDLVGPTHTRNQGIIGETADMTVEHLQDVRPSTLLFHLTKRLVYKEWRDAGEDPKLHLFGQLKRITKQWLDTSLVCKGGTYPALLLYEDLADAACNRITAGIRTALQGQRPIKALLDPYNPSGSTSHVRLASRQGRFLRRKRRCDLQGAERRARFGLSTPRVGGAARGASGLARVNAQAARRILGLAHRATESDRLLDRQQGGVRVNADIRLIVHRTDTSLLLCYVGHHDRAYAWAERRKLETHPATGAAQMIELRESIREIVVPAYVHAEAEPKPPTKPLVELSDDQLLAYGVPSEWLSDVRQADEDSLLALAQHLPAEAAEAILELATGGTPRPSQAVPVADPFAHPDAQRRFRVVTSVEELERALDAPWDKWAVFLHPEQRQMVTHEYAGPARVAGSAGTGKTVVALHRAVHLVRANPDGRILLATFSEPLAHALRANVKRLIGNEPRVAERLEVHAMSNLGIRLHQAQLGPVRLASREDVDALLREASLAAGEHKFSAVFMRTEWDQVVDAWQLGTWEEYRDVQRLGRRTRLPETRRAVLWKIFEQVREGLKARALMTEAAVFQALADVQAKRSTPAYDAVVVDEAQDISIAQLRFLAALAGGRPNGLFFSGDLGQRIFQQPFSWKALGVDVRGRSKTLRVNYRTSHQIREQADRLLGPEITDVDGNLEERRHTVSVFNGPAPQIRTFATETEESDAVSAWLQTLAGDGVQPHEIGVFVRSSAQVPRATAAMKTAGLAPHVLDDRVQIRPGGVNVATMHLAKGLEFRAVAVMACDDEVLPLQSRIEGVGDDGDLQEVYDTERQLLYVACTRARDRLLVSGVKPVSEFLDDLTGSH